MENIHSTQTHHNIISLLSLSVLEGCISHMGPRKVQRDRQSAHPFVHGLAAGHCSLQQVKIIQIITIVLHFTLLSGALSEKSRQCHYFFIINCDKESLCAMKIICYLCFIFTVSSIEKFHIKY